MSDHPIILLLQNDLSKEINFIYYGLSEILLVVNDKRKAYK